MDIFFSEQFEANTVFIHNIDIILHYTALYCTALHLGLKWTTYRRHLPTIEYNYQIPNIAYHILDIMSF